MPLIALGNGVWKTEGWKGLRPGVSSVLHSGVQRAERDGRCAMTSIDEYYMSQVRAITISIKQSSFHGLLIL